MYNCHQVITWTSVDLPSAKSFGIHSDEMFIEYQRFHPQIVLQIHTFKITATSPGVLWINK